MRILNEKLKKLGKLKLPVNSLDSHRFKERGQNRKSLTQVPDVHRIERKRDDKLLNSFFGDKLKGVNTSERIIDIAKQSPRGVWRVSKREVLDIARKYKFIVPNDETPSKHLGSTGIMLIRYKPGVFYLYKPKKQVYKRRRKRVDPLGISTIDHIRGI